MTRELTVQLEVDFGSGGRARKKMSAGERDTELPRRIPRVAKLMALAIRFESLLSEGVIADQAELARLGHVSRSRITQIMNLLNLAPDIHEQLLFLPPVEQGRDPLTERDLRWLVGELDWRKQQSIWRRHLSQQ